jgi:N-methylhydantoinase A
MTASSVDIGGTFTDIIWVDTSTGELRITKVASTPSDSSIGFMQGLEDINLEIECLERCVHGTTVATNTIIQKAGTMTGLITTKGFRDVMELARGVKPIKDAYNLLWKVPKPLVPRFLRIGVSERMNYRGEEIMPLDIEECLGAARFLIEKGVKSIAICFLFAYLNPSHEEQAAKLIRKKYSDVKLSLSSQILTQWREYERTMTTVADAYIKPLMADYISNLNRKLRGKGFRSNLLIMKSNGGVMTATASMERPIETFLSGPAGGAIAGKLIGERAGYHNLITGDMGGTSYDVSIMSEGRLSFTTQTELEPGIPIELSMLDIRTIGAGGGSIAWQDEGGALCVGPRSAGANPGPACYGLGGESSTVTDANLFLRRINPNYFLGGRQKLFPEPCQKALESLGRRFCMNALRIASGIVQIAVAKMSQEIKKISTEMGRDPRDFKLVAGGGAGPLHGVETARLLGCQFVIVPAFPGLLSAVGLLLADMRYDMVRSFPMVLEKEGIERIQEFIEQMATDGTAFIRNEGYKGEIILLPSVDMRYAKQNWAINIELKSVAHLDVGEIARSFDERHKELYGFSVPGAQHEIINLRLTALGETKEKQSILSLLCRRPKADADGRPKESRLVYQDKQEAFVETRVYDRENLPIGCQVEGPAIVEEMDSTCYIPRDSSGLVDKEGNILIKVD